MEIRFVRTKNQLHIRIVKIFILLLLKFNFTILKLTEITQAASTFPLLCLYSGDIFGGCTIEATGFNLYTKQ